MFGGRLELFKLVSGFIEPLQFRLRAPRALHAWAAGLQSYMPFEEGEVFVLAVAGHDDGGVGLGGEVVQEIEDAVAVDVVEALGGFVEDE